MRRFELVFNLSVLVGPFLLVPALCLFLHVAGQDLAAVVVSSVGIFLTGINAVAVAKIHERRRTGSFRWGFSGWQGLERVLMAIGISFSALGLLMVVFLLIVFSAR